MTLQEVMKVMASEYGFIASYGSLFEENKTVRLIIIRVKMYKKRLRDYNYRKNIRSTESDAQTYQNILSLSEQRPAGI